MLKALHRHIVGDELYPFVDSIDYPGFLEAGGTPELWEQCINALHNGFPGYTGVGSYIEYLRSRDNWLDCRYEVFDAEKAEVEHQNIPPGEVKARRSADIREIIEFVTRHSGQATPNRIFVNCLDPRTGRPWFTDLDEVNKLVILLVRDGTLYYPVPGYLGVSQ